MVYYQHGTGKRLLNILNKPKVRIAAISTQCGFSLHFLMPVVAIIGVAIVGTVLIHASRAASTPYSGTCTTTIISTSTKVTTTKYKTCIEQAQDLLDGIQFRNYKSYRTATSHVSGTFAYGSEYYLTINGAFSSAMASAVKVLPGNGSRNSLTNSTNGTWQIVCSDAEAAGLATGGAAANSKLSFNTKVAGEYANNTNAAFFKDVCGSVPSSGSGSTTGEGSDGVLAATPPMGYNDWYTYGANITEQDILTQAKALVSTGLSKLGYNYVVIDDGWQAPERAANGSLQANSTTFPHGIAWLASQVHVLGLKLGIYEAYGPGTCTDGGALPGSFDHYQQDADTFASWGIDFVKFDNCVQPPAAENDPTTLFPEMGTALQASGRSMVYSQELPVLVSNNIDPQFTPYSASNATQFTSDVAISAKTSNMWRVAPDFQPTVGDATYGNGSVQLMKHMDNDLPLYTYAGPGHWNDLDMILAGNSAFDTSLSQGTTQMSIWAELASPLFISTDLTKVPATTLSTLTNKAVIAIDQSGAQGRLDDTVKNAVDVIAKPYPGGGYAVLLVNTTDTNQTVSFPVNVTGETAGSSTFTNVWSDAVAKATTTFTQSLAAYSTVLYRVQ